MTYPTDKPVSRKPKNPGGKTEVPVDFYGDIPDVDQFGMEIANAPAAVETVEVTFTTVIEELVLGDGGLPLFHHLLDIVQGYNKNGVYKVPNRDGRNITVTVEGL